MITRPHICLRCQLRLARLVPSRIQVAFQSSTTSRPNNLKNTRGEKAEPIKQHHVRPGYLHQTDLSRRPLLSQYPMGRLYGHTGKKQREEREHLDISSLGEPADVIVLRDSKFRTYNYADTVEPDEAPQSIDILATLDSERGLVGHTEVEENINQFRPKGGEEPQDWNGFNSLVQNIQAGFTVSQLARYIQSFSEINEGNSTVRSSRSLIPRISPWMPETSLSTQHLDDGHTRGYSLASYTNKQRLVLRLLRECWKLELPELEGGVGEVELELKPSDYDLLLRGPRPALGMIAAEHIGGEDERIDGFRSRHTIRLTTTRQKSELIINEIEQTLGNIRREDVSLSDLMRPGHNWRQLQKWVDSHFNDSTIKDLSRMTNTEIQLLSKKRLLISCIDQNPGSVKGNKIDIVIRLLVTSGNFSNRVINWLGVRESAGAASRIFIKYTAIDGLGWSDRLHQWTRWTAPIAKKADDESAPQKSDATLEAPVNDTISPGEKEALPPAMKETPELAVAADKIADTIEIKQLNRTKGETSASQSGPRSSVHWGGNYHIESSALIGSVLHSYPDDSNTDSTKALQPTGKSSGIHRAFSTAVPNLSMILSSTSAPAISRKPSRTLVMHFQPNPFSKSSKTSKPIGGAALSAFPQIEIRFSIDPKTMAFKVRDIQAVVSVGNSDLMLPESPSDVRFQQRTLSPLVAFPDQYPPGIAEFIRNSNLDIGQANFDCPPKLTVPIAPHLCKEPGFELLGDVEEGGAMRDVEYLFAGLEIRKTVTMEYEGWRLNYTSIEAGRAGGRRGELRLLPVRVWKTGHADTEEDFLEAACRLADGLGTGNDVKVARTVQTTKPITKVMESPKSGPSDKIPRYFAKRVDIRHPSEQRQDKNMRESSGHLAEVDERPYVFGEDVDEDEFA